MWMNYCESLDSCTKNTAGMHCDTKISERSEFVINCHSMLCNGWQLRSAILVG